VSLFYDEVGVVTGTAGWSGEQHTAEADVYGGERLVEFAAEAL
jgi:hypothetical protein